MTLAQFLNLLWSILSVVAEVITLLLVVSLFVPKVKALFSGLITFISKHSIELSFVVALCATVGSLLYSDVLGYEPCKLCWFQRIFMYPQVILLGIAIWKKEKMIALYGIILSSIGGVIALYHFIAQLGWDPLHLPCLAVGYSVSCSKVFVLQFGYITIPVMALSAFALIIAMLVVSRREDKVSQ